ncbi:formylglycine-generating enzyme family protein [Roseiconus nitratireducens]|uniref:Formylglycine-generating enzyme family protein n=1 Tax=Roseiconus nitratireducens TaxID=2605748 RepID=A0A5M6DAL8_9BACT|nr:SUMF1/EgtB/PvdO family nonheme iron enzyme [Roseiconus nitratireducens]KAA5544598.1 formylglycine-generating enzyme family protein [Roseiconus nitratireducens]
MPFANFFSRPFAAFRAGLTGTKSETSSISPPTLDYPEAPPDIRMMIRARQYAKIVAPRDGTKFDEDSLRFAWKAIDHDMAYVPGGTVLLRGEYATTVEDDLVLVPQTIGECDVESVYLDRWCVTNADYLSFIEAGGYDDVNLWPEHILESVLQFVDQTMQPGPANWVNGMPPKGSAAHPVVGISWYEANAYAQWVGKRLPTSAEWQRAGTWGRTSSDTRTESRYPWGSSFDPRHANTWASGTHQTTSIHEFLSGNTPNGVRQLIGNVWEWMNTQYLLAATDEICVLTNDPMAEIRGGAFDTYFHSHATCQSRSAQTLSARKSNIGFRCCLSADQLAVPGETEMTEAVDGTSPDQPLS